MIGVVTQMEEKRERSFEEEWPEVTLVAELGEARLKVSPARSGFGFFGSPDMRVILGDFKSSTYRSGCLRVPVEYCNTDVGAFVPKSAGPSKVLTAAVNGYSVVRTMASELLDAKPLSAWCWCPDVDSDRILVELSVAIHDMVPNFRADNGIKVLMEGADMNVVFLEGTPSAFDAESENVLLIPAGVKYVTFGVAGFQGARGILQAVQSYNRAVAARKIDRGRVEGGLLDEVVEEIEREKAIERKAAEIAPLELVDAEIEKGYHDMAAALMEMEHLVKKSRAILNRVDAFRDLRPGLVPKTNGHSLVDEKEYEVAVEM